MNLISKIKNSGLFPDDIKKLLISSETKGQLDDFFKQELEQMLEEEKNAIEAINKEKEEKIQKI